MFFFVVFSECVCSKLELAAGNNPGIWSLRLHSQFEGSLRLMLPPSRLTFCFYSIDLWGSFDSSRCVYQMLRITPNIFSPPLQVCCAAQLPATSSVPLVRRVPRLEATPLGRKVLHLRLHRSALPSVRSLLPHGAQESLRPLHPQAFHQVHLPHGLLPDFPLPAAPGIPAHCHHRTGPAGTCTHCCGVDDPALGPGWENNTHTLIYRVHIKMGLCQSVAQFRCWCILPSLCRHSHQTAFCCVHCCVVAAALPVQDSSGPRSNKCGMEVSRITSTTGGTWWTLSWILSTWPPFRSRSWPTSRCIVDFLSEWHKCSLLYSPFF